MDADWEQLQPTSPPSASRSALLLLRTHSHPVASLYPALLVLCCAVCRRPQSWWWSTGPARRRRRRYLCCGSAHCLLLPPLQSSLKVRCVTTTCGGQGLNMTTLSRDKRGKGLCIRKEKEGRLAAPSSACTSLSCCVGRR